MIWYIILLPIFSFVTSGIIAIYNYKNDTNKTLSFLSWCLSCIFIGFSFIVSLLNLIHIIKVEDTVMIYELYNWFFSGSFSVNFSLYFDSLVLIMVTLITFISFLVHFYSYFYISKNLNLARFLSYLSLFTFSMIILVTSNNLIQMFIGWELISLCSYLLIVFSYKDDQANKSSSKAMLVNRFADIGYLIGTFSLLALLGHTNFSDIKGAIDSLSWVYFNIWGIDIYYLDFISVCFLLAAFAKSAQIGLHIWLPDAMEAPTPVSALLHAATMVTAGIFLIIKLSPIYEEVTFANNLILILAGITVLYGAISACAQKDIKKIIAYSTISQLGYMFLAIGVGAYYAGFFHLVTHAFFKALLFLGAGSVIHAMNGEQNIYKMGNLWQKTPITYICMIVGFLALIGIPGFSGFYSKEAVLNYLNQDSNYDLSIYIQFAYYAGLLGVFFTAFYSLRLIINVFHLSENYNKDNLNIHESSIGILFVLVTLAILSVVSGSFLYDSFVGHTSQLLWNDLYVDMEIMPKELLNHNIEYITIGLSLLALIFIYIFYIREPLINNRIKTIFPITYKLILNKFYFDTLYQTLIVNPSLKLSSILNKFDYNLYDKYGVNSFASFIYRISRISSRLQTGAVSFYALVMVIGVILLLAYCIFMMGIK